MSYNTLYEILIILCIVLRLHILSFYYFFGIFVVILTSIWIHGMYVCVHLCLYRTVMNISISIL